MWNLSLWRCQLITYHCGEASDGENLPLWRCQWRRELITVEMSVTERTYHCGDVSDRTTTTEMSVKNLPLTSSSLTSSVTERTYHCGDVSEEFTTVEMSVKYLPLWRCQWRTYHCGDVSGCHQLGLPLRIVLHPSKTSVTKSHLHVWQLLQTQCTTIEVPRGALTPFLLSFFFFFLLQRNIFWVSGIVAWSAVKRKKFCWKRDGWQVCQSDSSIQMNVANLLDLIAEDNFCH